MNKINIIFWTIFLGLFTLQLMVCYKSKKKIIRVMPLLIIGILAIFFMILYFANGNSNLLMLITYGLNMAMMGALTGIGVHPILEKNKRKKLNKNK